MRAKFFVSILSLLAVTVSAFAQNEYKHVIKAEKALSADFKASLYDTNKKIYKGKELKTIGMPCGGVAAGQLYVRGDGSLACWWIANNAYNTGYGISELMNFKTKLGDWKSCYQTFEPFSYVEQYFQIKVKSHKNTIVKKLNKEGFDAIEFIGEYPIANVSYKDSKKELPVDVDMEVFSPFIPCDLRNSANPATILKFIIKNPSKEKVGVELKGVLQNMVMRDLKDSVSGVSCNATFSSDVVKGVKFSFKPEDENFVRHPYNGDMAISILDKNGVADADASSELIDLSSQQAQNANGNHLNGSVTGKIDLKPGETKEVTFILSWYFPNRHTNEMWGATWNQPNETTGPYVGQMYANWYDSAEDVALKLSSEIGELSEKTHLFHDVWYNNSNLPYWLLQRIMMPVSTLATETCQWWSNGKIWSWEGVGSCVGTCTHVWNYAQAQAFLFPEFERNVRERTDFDTSFMKDGSIQTRNGIGDVAIDGHLGTILKVYREHLDSKDNTFLYRNWENVKKAMAYVIKCHDVKHEGLIEGSQLNTYDISFYGANTYVGALYLCALRAAEQMAYIMQDNNAADEYHKLFESGKHLSDERLWNGEYFIQDVDLSKHPESQYANGCLSDQLFGQTWAHILNLGYLYDEAHVKGALKSIWKYNWTPDVKEHNSIYVPERTYADYGEAGLINCTFPRSKHLDKSAVRYRNEVWTGIEYQVATNMIYDGMTNEALSIVRGVHDRYSPEKHNPWNEIECGDHYARALASWGVLLALEGYYYDGPNGCMQFAPAINKTNFKAPFTSAMAWGNIEQTINKNIQINTIIPKYGEIKLCKFVVPANSQFTNYKLKYNGTDLSAESRVENGTLTVSFEPIVLHADDKLSLVQKK